MLDRKAAQKDEREGENTTGVDTAENTTDLDK